MLTITCPFSGKADFLDRFFNQLTQLQLPQPAIFVALNTSADPEFSKALKAKCEPLGVSSEGGSFEEVVFLEEHPSKFNSDVGEIYNYLLPHIKGDWFSLEDDVFFPKDILFTLQRVLLQNYQIGIVSAVMADRHTPRLTLAWNIAYNMYDEPYLISAHPTPRWSVVAATHMGCTLIRPVAYSGYKFHVKGPYKHFYGQDIHLCIDAAKHEVYTATVWSSPAGHWGNNSVMYPLLSPNLFPSFTCQRSTPLVTVITPTRNRLSSLQNVISQLQHQTYPHYEHLICHDGPNSEVAQHVTGLKDVRHQYFELAFTHGFSGAPQRNAMLQRASGDLIVFVDDDADILDCYLQTMVDMWKEGYALGFAQIESPDHPDKIIPPTRDKCLGAGYTDTLCGYVDSAIGKGFFWDLFAEGHDTRYWNSIASYVKTGYGFTEKVVGRSVRTYERVKLEAKEAKDYLRLLASKCEHPAPNLEELFSRDAEASLTYAMNALRGQRFPQGEEAIGKNPRTLIYYCHNVLGGQRLESGEACLELEPRIAVQYARDIVKSRFQNIRIEASILSEPSCAVQYSLDHQFRLPPEKEEWLKQFRVDWNTYRLKWGLS